MRNNAIEFFCFNIASISKAQDKYKLYALFNELNSTYKYVSFYEDNEIISAKVSLPFNDNFDADLVFQTLSIIFRAVDEEYPKILSTLHN